MRPHRSDIPLPPLPPGMFWVGREPPAAERLTAHGPLLVHFFESGEVSSYLSLKTVADWATHYADTGLSVIGVHTPRSDLARSPEALAAAVARLDLDFPVCSDTEYRVWQAYGCKGWPSLFLWGRGGRLRWFHFGIADLQSSEAAIREELQGADADRALPEPLAGAPRGKRKLIKPSDEVFPGGTLEHPWIPAAAEPLEVQYAGGGSFASLDGTGSVRVTVDDAGEQRRFDLDGPGVYELARHDKHGMHEVRLDFDGSIRVWSVGFSPGQG